LISHQPLSNIDAFVNSLHNGISSHHHPKAFNNHYQIETHLFKTTLTRSKTGHHAFGQSRLELHGDMGASHRQPDRHWLQGLLIPLAFSQLH
jgi:hypothetical protein